jgi:hypothetical protein
MFDTARVRSHGPALCHGRHTDALARPAFDHDSPSASSLSSLARIEPQCALDSKLEQSVAHVEKNVAELVASEARV